MKEQKEDGDAHWRKDPRMQPMQLNVSAVEGQGSYDEDVSETGRAAAALVAGVMQCAHSAESETSEGGRRPQSSRSPLLPSCEASILKLKTRHKDQHYDSSSIAPAAHFQEWRATTGAFKILALPKLARQKGPH